MDQLHSTAPFLPLDLVHHQGVRVIETPILPDPQGEVKQGDLRIGERKRASFNMPDADLAGFRGGAT
jgi:hypothetical protein